MAAFQGFSWDGKPEGADPRFQFMLADPDFPSTFRVPFVEGGVPPIVSDAPNLAVYLVNESAAAVMNARGRMGMALHEGKGGGKVTGIVKDFHATSLRYPVEPCIVMLSPTLAEYSGSYAFFRLDPARKDQAMAAVRDAWERINPDWPFEAYALEKDIRTLFTAERRTALILQIASVTAIVICALGLLGLAAFLTRQRTREIGIRKVLGASSSGVIILLSREFMKWVVVANLLAWPIGYFVLRSWLGSFAYRTTLTLPMFMGAALGAFAIAAAVIGLQTYRAATANPADSIRYE
jgi:putative ABC transport system permease protein